MAIVLLVRHGRTGANAVGTLAGRTAGVELDGVGRDQVASLGRRLAGLPLAGVVTSPLKRCRQTVAAVTAARADPAGGPEVAVDERLSECEYGDWTGRSLTTLARDPLWKIVQAHPSAATFPGGESLRRMQARAVEAVREHDARITDRDGPDALWVAVSHGDVIKSVVADALGLHLDQFQRIVADPGSVTVVRYTPLRPFLVRLNDTGGDLAGLCPPRRRRGRRDGDAPVGGGAGTP